MGTYHHGETYVASYMETHTGIVSVELILQRESDGLFLDFSDLTFKPLSHVSPSRFLSGRLIAGTVNDKIYRDNTGYVLPNVDEAYIPILRDSDGVYIPAERIVVRGAAAPTFTITAITSTTVFEVDLLAPTNSWEGPPAAYLRIVTASGEIVMAEVAQYTNLGAAGQFTLVDAPQAVLAIGDTGLVIDR